MKVLIVAEGKHESGERQSTPGAEQEPSALKSLVQQLTKKPQEFAFKRLSSREIHAVHAVRGKGGGIYKRALRWLIKARESEFDAVILLVDHDGDDSRVQQIDNAQVAEIEPVAGFPRALGVAVQTFDAWMLADETALSKVLNATIQTQKDPEKAKDPKGICVRLRDESNSDCSLTEMYAGIAECVDLDKLKKRCPIGFARFAERVGAL